MKKIRRWYDGLDEADKLALWLFLGKVAFAVMLIVTIVIISYIEGVL